MEEPSSLLVCVGFPELRKSTCTSVHIDSDLDARQDAMDVDEPVPSSSSASSPPPPPPPPPSPPKQLSSTILGSAHVKKYADRAMKERLEEEEKVGAGADSDYTKRTEAKADSKKM